MRSILVAIFCLVLVACDGNTELMKATINGNNEQVKKLLDSGTDVNEKNNYL